LEERTDRKAPIVMDTFPRLQAMANVWIATSGTTATRTGRATGGGLDNVYASDPSVTDDGKDLFDVGDVFDLDQHVERADSVLHDHVEVVNDDLECERRRRVRDKMVSRAE
jgi:hypothetical protein